MKVAEREVEVLLGDAALLLCGSPIEEKATSRGDRSSRGDRCAAARPRAVKRATTISPARSSLERGKKRLRTLMNLTPRHDRYGDENSPLRKSALHGLLLTDQPSHSGA